MRVPLAAACAALALLTGCSDGGSSARPTPTPSTAVDPFSALEPPVSPGVGEFPRATAQRAYATTQGILTTALAEPGSLTGTAAGTAELLAQLAVPDDVLGIDHYLRPPSKRGLDIRPLFARTVTLDANPVEVVRSSYTADPVQGAAGEQGIKIGWDGAVRYRVRVGGVAHQVAYVLRVSFIYAPIPNEPGGLQLVAVIPGTSHATPVVTSCLAKGVLLPAAGTPTSSDFGPGPWLPDAPGPACPV